MDYQEKNDIAANPYAPPESSDGNEAPRFDYRVVVFWGCSALLVYTAWATAGLTLAALVGTCAIVVSGVAWRGKGHPTSTLVECWVCIAILWILWGLLMPAVQGRGRRRGVPPPIQEEMLLQQVDGPQDQGVLPAQTSSDASESNTPDSLEPGL